ncbi:hypothetical protein [Leifsonia aquatica]|uniref:hypothetical protein n=1 Tax=Leifsonia aquatica TaxID=144185 RepID=UPI00046A1B02|nr:hypothetical protein [Leifsonia aquatica]
MRNKFLRGAVAVAVAIGGIGLSGVATSTSAEAAPSPLCNVGVAPWGLGGGNFSYAPGSWCVYSTDYKYQAIFQSDGNFVVYRGSTALWQSRTYGLGATRLVLQGDGNFAIYRGDTALWNANTRSSTYYNRTFEMQTDGNAVIYGNSPGKVALWWSDTRGK